MIKNRIGNCLTDLKNVHLLEVSLRVSLRPFILEEIAVDVSRGDRPGS